MTLFNVLIHTSTVSMGNQLMVDITALRHTFARYEITDIGWCRSGQTVADGCTKPGKFPPLEMFLDTGTLHYEVAQWVVRSPPVSLVRVAYFVGIVGCVELACTTSSCSPLPSTPFCLCSTYTEAFSSGTIKRQHSLLLSGVRTPVIVFSGQRIVAP